MTTKIHTSKTAVNTAAITRHPPYSYAPDSPKKNNMNQHLYIVEFTTVLIIQYRDRDDVLVNGSGYLRLGTGNPRQWLVPDCIVAFGVDAKAITESNGYTISEVGKPPDFVLEVASESTGQRDYTIKRIQYARFGVIEYWRFDPTGGNFHDVPLAGDILVNGVYRPIEIHKEPSGLEWGYSPALDLELCRDGGRLRLRNPITKEYLRNGQEAEQRGDAESIARIEAELRADRAEAEVQRLRELLKRTGRE